MKTKECLKCKEQKLLSDFFNSPIKKDGHHIYCKSCCKLLRKIQYEKHKLKRNEECREYKRLNKDKIKNYNRKYIKTNKEYFKNYRKLYNQRKKLDPTFQMNKRMSKSIGRALNGKKSGRHWEDLVNYNRHDLIKHLESKFKDGMSWKNYGEWHVDHIRPKSWFKYTDVSDEEFKKCWALENLQPLWAKDNFSKRNRYEG